MQPDFGAVNHRCRSSVYQIDRSAASTRNRKLGHRLPGTGIRSPLVRFQDPRSVHLTSKLIIDGIIKFIKLVLYFIFSVTNKILKFIKDPGRIAVAAHHKTASHSYSIDRAVVMRSDI